MHFVILTQLFPNSIIHMRVLPLGNGCNLILIDLKTCSMKHTDKGLKILSSKSERIKYAVYPGGCHTHAAVYQI